MTWKKTRERTRKRLAVDVLSLRLRGESKSGLLRFFTQLIHPRLPGSWFIKGKEESTLCKDSSATLMHYVPSDVGLLCLVKKCQICFWIFESNLGFSWKNAPKFTASTLNLCQDTARQCQGQTSTCICKLRGLAGGGRETHPSPTLQPNTFTFAVNISVQLSTRLSCLVSWILLKVIKSTKWTTRVFKFYVLSQFKTRYLVPVFLQ